MKKTLLSIAVLLSAATAFCQTTVYSNLFDEPEGLGVKVVQCSNGSTFLFNFTKKEGIETTVYNRAHKTIKHATLEGKGWEPRSMVNAQVDGIYEIKGKLVLFLEQPIDRTPMLFRIVYDTATGSVLEQKKIAEMPAYGAGAGYAMAFGGVSPKTFYVEKDPKSDYYAVILFDGFAKETAHRIEMIHFDGDHKEINRAFYDSPENRYKYIRYISSTVNEDKGVYLCTYAWNTEATGDKASKVFFSKLTKGSTSMEHKALDLTEDFKSTNGILLYNEGLHALNLLTLTQVSTKNRGSKSTTYYQMLLSCIDPESMVIVYTKELGPDKISDIKKQYLPKKKEGFSGLPQNMIINPDNSITIVMEEAISTSTTVNSGFGGNFGGGGFGGGGMSHQVTMSYMNDVGILDVNMNGSEADAYWLPKQQQAKIGFPSLWQNLRNKNYQTFNRTIGLGGYANNGFYSFNYISTPKGRYVIFNDHPDNFDKDFDKPRQNVVGITETNTVCFKVQNGKVEHSYLYGVPPKGNDSRFAYISSGHYSKETNTYAALIIDNFGKTKQARMAWTSFE